MPLTVAIIAEVVSIGKNLYDFIDKVSSGTRGDTLQPIITKLDNIRTDIFELGQTILQALDRQLDAILEEFRRTQLSRLPGAHSAITNYIRTHAPNSGQSVPEPPIFNDPNYVAANLITSEVTNYFRDRPELVFMGGFVYAMNVRIEFITSLNSCWFDPKNGFIDEIRRAVNQLNGYISLAKSLIDGRFFVRTKTKTVIIDPTTRPPLKEVVSITYSVHESGTEIWSRTVSPEEADAAKNAANSVRNSRSAARQAELMSYYDQIAAKWNGLIQNFASAAVQRALLPRSSSVPLFVKSSRLAVSNLQVVEPAVEMRSNGSSLEVAELDDDESKPPTYIVPLRDLLLDVLTSPEFEQRQDSALRSNDSRVVNMWFRKAFHREPTADESATLVNVMKLFGYKSFFNCLCYSHEYEQRYGEGLPTPEGTELEEHEMREIDLLGYSMS